MKFHGWFKPQHDFQYAKRALKAGLHGFEITGGESHYDPEEFKGTGLTSSASKTSSRRVLPSMPP